ncbi:MULTISPECIES: bacterial proteasome activator family protein [unclassified Arthrobacter]|uniref:bacterial proteasome activator family protein n=1 Tax=unclassified Arthrobacter TaxID=235627 RepID=UPI000CE429CE|nr:MULTISPECIES: bacterial proteasome activator family protein [unclassified Arthrobacter]
MSEKAQIPAPDNAAEDKVVDGVLDGLEAPGQQGTSLNESEEPAPTKKSANVASMVDQPAKVMRIGTMIKQLLDEVKSAPLDDAARARLAEIHQASIAELEDGLAPELVAELHRLSLPFSETKAPSDAELRIAQAQLVGWLEGLFHGIQTALAAQAMANQQTASRLALHQLPPGTVIAPGVVVGPNGEPQRAPVGSDGPRAVPGDGPGSMSGGVESGSPGQYL